MDNRLVTLLFILVALAVVASLVVALVGLALVFPQSTRSKGGKLLLIGGVGLIVFAGLCFGGLPMVAG